jgi:uncharacterized protein YraI
LADIDRFGNKIFTGFAMKTKHWLILSALVLNSLWISAGRAEETAIIRANRVNVRGQPTMFSEVVTQLKEGESITILDQIQLAKPKLGEPTNWVKIKMPVNTPVWVNASFIDATNKTVTSPKLNVRAGPGENFSVLGTLKRGDAVKDIRVVDDWMEIQTPESAYGFLSSEYLKKTEGKTPELAAVTPPVPNAVSAKAQPELATPPVIAPPPAVIEEKVQVEPAVTPAVDAPPLPKPETVETAPVAKPAVIEVASQPKMVPPETITLPAVAPPVAKPAEEPIRRVVTREGIVRSTSSIQAPTPYELGSAENRKTLDFLMSTTTNIVVKQFRGQRVLVSGEEFIDSRWPLTPILQIETLEPTDK